MLDNNNKPAFDICSISIDIALEEYDKCIFASQMVELGASREQVYQWRHWKLERDNEVTTQLPAMKKHQDYDSFNIDNFYTFCRVNPLNDNFIDYRYSFCDLERNESLE